MAANRYVPRGRNELHTIFERHFDDFCEQYDEKLAATYGRYRLERIQQIGERFSTCGDYLQGVARIRCTNPECGHDYFRPFAEVSRLIYDILREFYHEAASGPLLTGMIIAHQKFGDQLRFNPHFHAIVLEGGFDEEGTFFYIPFAGLQYMVEVFRRRVIKLLVERELLNEDFARNLLSWKHSAMHPD